MVLGVALVVVVEALVLVVEVSLGGRGVTTTPDGRGPPDSPPEVVEELGPARMEEVVVVLELTLGGRGVTTTSDGHGPPVSPPATAGLCVLDPEVVSLVVKVVILCNVFLINSLS